MKIKIIGTEKETFAKRFFYLAWKASQVVGMGVFQDQGDQPEDVVWLRIVAGGDIGRVHDVFCADYVFGRMMKLTMRSESADTIILSDSQPRSDYQSWCLDYPTYMDLVNETAKQLDCKIERVL